MKYESEILYDLMKRDGLLNPSQDNLPYESELKEKYVSDVEGAYPKLQDYRAEWLNYNKCEYIPADFPTETQTNQTSGTFENVVPYVYKSAILKGQTLVNLIASDTIVSKSGGSATFINNKLRVNFPNYNWSGITIKNTGMFKPSTKYTIIAKATNTTSFKIEIGHNNTSFNAFTPINDSRMVLQSGETGSLKIALTTRDDLQIGSNVYNVLCAENPSSFSGNKFIDVELMIIEGDYTNVNIPYFEGMQSVQMPVLTTTGKNLFNKDNAYLSGALNQNIRNDIFIKPNTTYTFYANENNWVGTYLYDKNDILTREVGNTKTTKSITFTTTSEEVKAVFQYHNGGNTTIESSDFNGVQLEYGTQITSYEPYKSNILTVNEEVELGSVGEVKDELNLLTGQLTQRTETRAYQEGDESNSEVLTDMTNTRYKLPKEVIKTVDLSCINENNEECDFIPIMDTMHYQTSSDTIPPLVDLTVCVEAITRNLASFVKLEGIEGNE